VGILDVVRQKIGAKSTKTEVRDAEIAVDKIRAVIDVPAKRLAEAKENVTRREAQLAAAEADAAARALAGDTVNDYTPIQAALAHDQNTVKAYQKALDQIRAEQEPALQAALAELARARKADRRFHFENAARRFRESWVAAMKAHAEMMEAYVVGDHPQLFVPTFSDARQFEPWDEVFDRWANKPAPVKAEDHPARVVRFEGQDAPMWDRFSAGDEAFLSEDDAFRAVVAGAAHYSFDTPETRELTAKAAKERVSLRKYPRFAEDFPQQ
jgi:hypothetical protein